MSEKLAAERGALALMSMSDSFQIVVSLHQDGMMLALPSGIQHVPSQESQSVVLQALARALPRYATEILGFDQTSTVAASLARRDLDSVPPPATSSRAGLLSCQDVLPTVMGSDEEDLPLSLVVGRARHTHTVSGVGVALKDESVAVAGHGRTSGYRTAGSKFTPINAPVDDDESEGDVGRTGSRARRVPTVVANPRLTINQGDIAEILPSCINLSTGFDPAPRGAHTLPPRSAAAVLYQRYEFFCEHPGNRGNKPCAIQLQDKNYTIFRTCVADCFGRNKVETKAIDRMLRYCRKHYQKVSYRKGVWLKHRVEMVKRVIEILRYDRPTIRFRVQLRSTKVRLMEEYCDHLRAIDGRLGDIRPAIMGDNFVPDQNLFLTEEQKKLRPKHGVPQEVFEMMKDHFANFIIDKYYAGQNVQPDRCLLLCNLLARMIKCGLLRSLGGFEFLPELDGQVNRLTRPRTATTSRDPSDPQDCPPSDDGPSRSAPEPSNPTSSPGNLPRSSRPRHHGSRSVRAFNPNCDSDDDGQPPHRRFPTIQQPIRQRVNLFSPTKQPSSNIDSFAGTPRRRTYAMIEAGYKPSKYPGFDTDNDPYETEEADSEETEWEESPGKPARQTKRVKLIHRSAEKF